VRFGGLSVEISNCSAISNRDQPDSRLLSEISSEGTSKKTITNRTCIEPTLSPKLLEYKYDIFLKKTLIWISPIIEISNLLPISLQK
jgi:hypothetical protein